MRTDFAGSGEADIHDASGVIVAGGTSPAAARIREQEGVIMCLNSDIAGALADRRSLEVENENLKHRIALLTQDPESLASQFLSKVNALTMVCQTRDELKTELAICKSQRDDNENAWQCEKQKRIAADAEVNRVYRERVLPAESERDTAREQERNAGKLAVAHLEGKLALQAKVARAVALLNMVETDQTDAPHMQECISAALEALR